MLHKIKKFIWYNFINLVAESSVGCFIKKIGWPIITKPNDGAK